MKNISEINDKILKILSKVLKISTIEIKDDFEMNKVPNWDSVAHLDIITSFEEEFNIQFESNDIPKLVNLKNIKQIIQKKLKNNL